MSAPVLFQRVLAASVLALLGISNDAVMPRVNDDRLELRLFAADPEIVTPIGLAIDRLERLFVIESHTHTPPRNYKGPKSDRIKVFEDSDGDGSPERVTVFAEGLTNAMNLAFTGQGELLLVSSHTVEALFDVDRDGKADTRRRLLELKTSNRYSHSALLGIAYTRDGWVYVSRGNNGSAAYEFIASDGSRVSGYGDGGNIVRCRLDGSKLEEFATGFWNPFDIKFDSRGRLLCVDNDPDARGPNRLLHIVRGGDYGYKSLYGGAGNHPFQGWEGEIPGTLPMIDGTGEAPSGLLDAILTSLPHDYENSLLVTIWNENTITKHVTRTNGVSLVATNSVLVSGGEDFRPVAMAADGKGNIYITDWVLVDYPNHGRGRIWKLSTKTSPRLNPRSPWIALTDAGMARLNGMATTYYARVLPQLSDDDPFIRHAAVMALAKPEHKGSLLAAFQSGDPKVRLGVLLVLRRLNSTELLREALRDQDSEVRRLAMMWVGESGLTDLRAELDGAISEANLSPVNFETYLAAVACLDPEYIRAFGERKYDKANQLMRKLPAGLVEEIVNDERRPARVRALALQRLAGGGHFELIRTLLRDSDVTLQIEAVRSLALVASNESAAELRRVATDREHAAGVRAEAVAALSWHGEQPAEWVEQIRNDPAVRSEVARLLRTEKEEGRPADMEQWQITLAKRGDAAAGARVFFSARTACLQCHTIQNRGGKLGPDLSAIARSVGREQIVRSILRPSEQFPPQYQAWFIKTKDGEVHEGLQLDHEAGGLELLMRSGRFEKFPTRDIDSYGVLPRSLMPDGMEQTMTVGEFRDLVAFLMTLK